MSFDITKVLKDMTSAINDTVVEDGGDISQYAGEIISNESEALEVLASARLSGEINDEVFKREIERERIVLETELLTIEIMTSSFAQKAVNAAINVFVDAVKLAL